MPKRNRNRKAGKLRSDTVITNTQGRRNPGAVGGPTITRIGATGGVSDSARVTLRYVQRLTITTTAGAFVSNVFRGNGPFDPDQTGTGAQPVWYDDYSAMYNRQRCLGSRISVDWYMASNTGVSAVCGVVPQHVTTSLATIATAYAQPYVTTTACSAYVAGRATTQAVSTGKYLGYSGGGVMGSDALESLYSTTPSHQWYWHVFAAASDDSTGLNVNIIVTIDYDILWFDKVDGSLDYFRRLEQFKHAGRVFAIAKDDEKGDRKAVDVKASAVDDDYIDLDSKSGALEEVSKPAGFAAQQRMPTRSLLPSTPILVAKPMRVSTSLK